MERFIAIPPHTLEEISKMDNREVVPVSRQSFRIEGDFRKFKYIFPYYLDACIHFNTHTARKSLSIGDYLVVHSGTIFDIEQLLNDINGSNVRKLLNEDIRIEKQKWGNDKLSRIAMQLSTTTNASAPLSCDKSLKLRIVIPTSASLTAETMKEDLNGMVALNQEIVNQLSKPSSSLGDLSEIDNLTSGFSPYQGKPWWRSSFAEMELFTLTSLKIENSPNNGLFENELLDSLSGDRIPLEMVSESFPKIYGDAVNLFREIYMLLAKQRGYTRNDIKEDTWANSFND